MKKPKLSKSCRHLIGELIKDARQESARYPDQALLCLRDRNVISAVNERFERGESLQGIRLLAPHQDLGLIPILFEFHQGGQVALATTGILAGINSTCHVVLIDLEFNDALTDLGPPLRAISGARPLVLSEDTAIPDLLGAGEAMDQRQLRTARYLKRRGLLHRASAEDETETMCVYMETVLTMCKVSGTPPIGEGEEGEAISWAQDDDRTVSREHADDSAAPGDDVLGGVGSIDAFDDIFGS